MQSSVARSIAAMFTLVFVASCGGADAPSPSAAPPGPSAEPTASITSPSSSPSAGPNETTGEFSWSRAGSLADARVGHTATLLADGRVLVAGGLDVKGAAAEGLELKAWTTAEIYDPATGGWTVAAPMAIGRFNHTATLLADGTVLVAGGGTADEVDARSAELYDPAADRWTTLASMTIGRFAHTAFLLSDGRVLVAGGTGIGSTPPALASTEVYDPREGSWTTAASLAASSYDQVGADLGHGRALLIQGGPLGDDHPPDSNQSATTNLYDPATGRWTLAASMADARHGFPVARLKDGRVLAAGGGVGTSGGVLASAQLFDPMTGTWSSTGSMASQRLQSTATTILDGRVLVVGGGPVGQGGARNAELYDPASGSWSMMASMADPRFGHTATLLLDGSVLVVGGYAGPGQEVNTSAERFTPSGD